MFAIMKLRKSRTMEDFALLGHTTLQMTSRYTHAMPRDQFVTQVAEIVNEMFAQGQLDPSAKR